MLGLAFDLANFININTVIGAMLGGILSLAVSYYFFLRGKGLETITHWLSHNVSNAITQQQYPQFFGPMANSAIPNEPPPKNPDIPRLQVVIFSPPKAPKGEAFEVLCRVVDEGWNFPSSSGGMSIVDHHGRRHAVSGAGFGYMLAKIPVSADEIPGRYQLTFHMHDIDMKTNFPLNKFIQTVNFEVT